jgi:aminopeptidase N
MKLILLSAITLFFVTTGFSQFYNNEKKIAAKKMNFVASPETGNYDIVYQRILWKVDPAVLYINGEITSYFKTKENNFSAVYFDIIDALTIDSVKYNSENITFTHNNNLLKISLPDALSAGTLDSVIVYYQGVPESITGFGSFSKETHAGTPVLWTLSEPYGAREWWPCKQSLTDKIDSIDIYVKTPKEYKVGSNGVLMYENIEGDYKTTYWKHRYPIAAYLVAIAVTNYESFSYYAMVNTTDSVEILNYVYPEDLSNVKDPIKFTVDVVELYSNIFIPYPFAKEKYGHAQFGWGGGMEHQTMSFMGTFNLGVIAHELAHQWFGDYITCGSWQHIWVNEGFAVFCENITQEHLFSDQWKDWKKGRIEYILQNAKSGSVFCEDTSSANRIFSYPLTYIKGGMIIQMLRNQIGDEAFFTGIKNYLTSVEFAGKFAVAEDVQHFLEDAADTNLTQYFADWYYGQGYPKYTIKWNQDDDNTLNINISQTTVNSAVPFFALKVPVLLKGDSNEKLIYFYNTENNQDFTYNIDFKVTDVVFDPEYNIIAPHPANIVVGIDNIKQTAEIKLMPNPAKTSISIVSLEKHLKKIIIYDISGKNVYRKNIKRHCATTDINISDFNEGLYSINIILENGKVIRKQFVKEN